MSDERYEAGMQVRREVLGDAHVDRATANATDFSRPFQEFITRAAWGEVWTRPGLDRRTRSVITLSVLTALRAELARIRAQGWALVDQELEEGLRSVAAPIRDRSGRVLAAVNVSAHASRASRDTVRKALLPPLLATAQRIEADLRAAGPTPLAAGARLS